MSGLTPQAKSRLSTTIRQLRERLLRDLRGEAERLYRLSVPAARAGLDEACKVRRSRLEAWLETRVRAEAPASSAEAETIRARLLGRAVQEAAATLLNRLVLIRHMEALGMIRPALVSGGWSSPAMRELRDLAPDLVTDASEGHELMLRLLFDELALDLPGLFGEVGITRLIPVPASTLREVLERLDDPELADAWTDDTTLGWVYQYWNDPEREALDAKIHAGGKVAPHEIASKTQMFTERYMVEWLLHNSLGLTWLAMCRKHGWTPDAEQVLDELDRRRADWRARREAGEVALDALMPIAEGLEDRWKYWVPQPIPDDAVEAAPESIRDLKLLDPACGSGHFLIIAFDLLAALYHEEARHRGEHWSDQEIAESILEHNLHGVDIDPRAIQIAAAGLYLKVRRLSPEARIRRLNLVAPALNLARLPDDDPALERLIHDLQTEVGIPEPLTRRLVRSLAGVDHLGSLLKVDAAVEEAIRAFERETGTAYGQAHLFEEHQLRMPFGDAKTSVLEKLEQFLGRHQAEEDLGLRLDGEQLAAGLRFVRIVREGVYDIVVGNPPYQGTSKMEDGRYLKKHYPRGKADLYAAFIERAMEFSQKGGISAFVTMRGWQHLRQFQVFREALLTNHDLRVLCDLGPGAFEETSAAQVVLSVSLGVFRAKIHPSRYQIALRPLRPDGCTSKNHTNRMRSAVLSQSDRFSFSTDALAIIQGFPVIYWWDIHAINRYSTSIKLGDSCPVRQGVATASDSRFLRKPWEVDPGHFAVLLRMSGPSIDIPNKWAPFVKGAAGRSWIEPLSEAVNWKTCALELRNYQPAIIRNPNFLFARGIAYATIGDEFSARSHRFASVFGHMGSSVFPLDLPLILCSMNSTASQDVLRSLNPGLHFEVGDVKRLPIFPVESANEIYATLDRTFTEHESARENSVEFRLPGPSPWRYAQDWAQRSVDRPQGEPLPPYEPEYDAATPEQWVSFAIGVALGRFGSEGQGILDETQDEHRKLIENALPNGILFLSDATHRDSLAHPACARILEAWEVHGPAVGGKEDLRTYLRRSFFGYHKKLYENRPIYFPLSSSRRTFVAWVSIHRWRSDTLQTLAAEHLVPQRRQLHGELEELRAARAKGQRDSATERRFEQVKKALEELEEMLAVLGACTELGPPPTDASETRCPRREVDARFEMDLDDGVMVNSAGLWPLLDPQWKTGSCPKRWWTELALAKGRKDYDWSHLAARYFPTRVAAKCAEDPSLAVAHGCFWRLHPARAWLWERRLKHEIGPDFEIDEPDAAEHRARFLAEHPEEAAEIVDKEQARHERKQQRAAAEAQGVSVPLFDGCDNGTSTSDEADAVEG